MAATAFLKELKIQCPMEDIASFANLAGKFAGEMDDLLTLVFRVSMANS
jgi:hypothetical protein